MKSYETLTTHIVGVSEVQIDDVNEVLRQIKGLMKEKDIILQLVNADRITNEEHLQVASYHAQKAFQQNTATSNSLEIETLLYATGQRQITKALARVGLTPQTKNVAAIIYAPPNITNLSELIQEVVSILKGTQSDKVFALTPKKEKDLMQLFEIIPVELQTASLHELIIERMAMLELAKKPSQEISKR